MRTRGREGRTEEEKGELEEEKGELEEKSEGDNTRCNQRKNSLGQTRIVHHPSHFSSLLPSPCSLSLTVSLSFSVSLCL